MMLRSITLSAALLVAIPAAAQVGGAPATPWLKAQIAVSSDVVRIGDLLENAGAAADIAVFRAPDLGQTGMVQTARVIEAMRPHRLAEIDTRGIAEVAVTRTSRHIAAAEIEERIATAIAAQQGLPDAKQLAITFDHHVHTLQVDPSATGELKTTQIYYDRFTRRFDVGFELPGTTAQRSKLRFTGTAYETAPVALLANAVARGEVIKQGDVVIERRPRHVIGSNALDSIQQVVGLAARRPLQPNQPLRQADLMKPEIVRQNETITLFYEAPGITLSVRGKALASGAQGDVVDVLNLQSKRTVQGTVSGSGRVTVAAATPRAVVDVPPAKSVAAATPQQLTE